ncbi:LysR family transcriptional regulator [Advenella sp. FME57]|uniref:LysR family transcriptional regulator n=1 Tax=Advenella sp. FME57 TaxID=2742604 RepID=UPI001867C8C9
MKNIDLKKMKQFLTVAESNSITKAAERLRIAQSTLLAVIKKLEDAIGVSLINQQASSFELTLAGADFARHCRLCLEYSERAVWSARSTAKACAATINLGLVSSAAHTIFPRVLSILQKTQPDFNVNVHESTSKSIIHMLLERQIDMGLLRGPIDLPSELEVINLGRDEFVLITSEGHALADCLRVSPEMLCSEAFIMYDKGSVLRHAMRLFCQENNVNPFIAQEVCQIQTVAAMVGCGLGVSLVPKSTIPLISAPVRFIDLDCFSHEHYTGIYMAKRESHSSALLNRLFCLSATDF